MGYLDRLLTHKIRGTLPPTATTTSALHDDLKSQIVRIRDHIAYQKGTTCNFKDWFEHLKDVVWQWSDNNGCSKATREKLLEIIKELRKCRLWPDARGEGT